MGVTKGQEGIPTPLGQAIARCRGGFATVALFSACINMLMLAGPLYMLQVYDRVLTSGSTETLLLLTLVLALAFLAMATLETLRTALTVRIGAWLNDALGPAFLNSGLRARLTGSGGGGQAFRDLSQVQGFIATQGMTAFFDSPWTPLFLFVIWLLHPWLGILGLAAALILVALSVANEVVTRTLLRRANAGQIASHRMAEATIEHADAVRAMGMEAALSERWRRKNRDVQMDLLTASQRAGWITGGAKFVRMFAQSAILGLGAFLVLRGEATPGVMIAASIMLGRALAPVDMAMTAWKNFSAARTAYGRLKAQSAAFPEEPKRLSLPPPEGRVSVCDLTAFGPAGPVLRRVSFETAPGEVIAVIGPSAAGKSTLCRYLVGLAAPASGHVRLDGVDITHWNAGEVGKYVGYLPQEVCLFAGTVRENIARMGPASDAAVVEAARLARAHEMIAQLPEGYDTRLGDGGRGLSGGQRQRLGLARAVFGNPALVVLDEPNANLDQSGEAALGEAVADLSARGTTLIIVGHRPSTLSESHKILFLKEGCVQAFGPREEVLDKIREATLAARAATERETAETPQRPETPRPETPAPTAAATQETGKPPQRHRRPSEVEA